ncbi:MAG: ABC transporter ATP-binding protein [Candidatus Hodarchaeales archaeon]|jgi:ATP-binding cassette subfamily B protein
MTVAIHTKKSLIDEPTSKKFSQKRYYRSSRTLFFSFYKKRSVQLFFALIFLMITAAGQTLPAVLTARALTELGLNGYNDTFLLYCAFIIAVSIVFVISGFISNYIFFVASSAYERDIRQEFFDIIQSHSLTFHDENNSSKLLAMGMTEIQQMRMGIFPSQRMLITAFFSILLSLTFLYQISPIYAAITLIGTIFYLYFAYVTAFKISPVRRKLAHTIGELTESSQEIFRGIEVVRGLASSEREKNRFTQQSYEYAELAKQEGRFQAFYIPSLVLLATTALIFAVTTMDVWNGLIGIGQLIESVAILLMLQATTRMVPMAFLMVQAGMINAQRVWEVIHWADPQPDEAIELEEHTQINWKGDIILEDLGFSFFGTGGKKALNDINLQIKGGSKIALIGGPGSGKSTLLKILLRLYDPQEGEVRIDGKRFTEIPAATIRAHVSRVEQDIFLFSGTLRENIAFSKPNASNDDIMNAVKTAFAWEFIEKMPEQLDSIIGERGVTLSGGQRQRIGIARAILAEPDILLLDDSVSAIDSRTEMLMRKAIDNLLKNRTSFTVTQRLNTLVNADLVILLDRGNILEKGTHEELLQKSPEYRQIFELLPESEQIVHSDGGMVS